MEYFKIVNQKKVIALNIPIDDPEHKSCYEVCKLIFGYIDYIIKYKANVKTLSTIFLASNFNIKRN